MIHFQNWIARLAVLLVIMGLFIVGGCRKKAYENPITKDTKQPDKVLFDKAIGDIERGRYEVGRLTLQTLMNTYDTSEFLAKAKLAYADSWYREGGAHGLAQAEAEYKDFILFYPTLEEAAEAQEKVCMIHFKQMEKPDRDMSHALRAEDECRNLLVQFPNSKFAPRAQQTLRDIQEVIAEGEFRRGAFYHSKGSHPAASNRLQGLASHYPLFSHADETNWLLADSYSKMGPRFRPQTGEALAKIVRDYPLSPFVEDAKKMLRQMELPIPEADPVSYARQKYELENRKSPGMMSHATGIFRKSPDVSAAAKSGSPAMTGLRPSVPASVPLPGATAGGTFAGDVTAAPVTDTSALDSQPDARRGAQAQGAATGGASGTGAAAAGDEGPPSAGAQAPPAPAANAQQPLPGNHQQPQKPPKQKKQKKDKNEPKQ